MARWRSSLAVRRGSGSQCPKDSRPRAAAVSIVSRHADEATAAAEQITREYGVRAIGVGADVTDNDAVKRMVDRTIGQLGRIDILLNNAGINLRGPIDELTYDEFRQVQQVNVDGPWLCARAVTPFFKEQNPGASSIWPAPWASSGWPIAPLRIQ